MCQVITYGMLFNVTVNAISLSLQKNISIPLWRRPILISLPVFLSIWHQILQTHFLFHSSNLANTIYTVKLVKWYNDLVSNFDEYNLGPGIPTLSIKSLKLPYVIYIWPNLAHHHAIWCHYVENVIKHQRHTRVRPLLKS